MGPPDAKGIDTTFSTKQARHQAQPLWGEPFRRHSALARLPPSQANAPYLQMDQSWEMPKLGFGHTPGQASEHPQRSSTAARGALAWDNSMLWTTHPSDLLPSLANNERGEARG